MPEIKINQRTITVTEGETILSVARREGIYIPTMCWIEELRPSTSCMLCLVKDINKGKLVTSCSALVEEGMDIVTDNDEIQDMRKSALELLLSEHYGDCEAPCQRSCPAEMNIPLMNRLIASNRLQEAMQRVTETIALPGILGYICPAPCEKICRRKDIDQPLAICMLKRFVAEESYQSEPSIQRIILKNYTQKVAIIGAGPAGLAAAYYLAQQGFTCDVYDNNELAGGKMRTHITEEKLPRAILDQEIDSIASLGVKFYQQQDITTKDIAGHLSVDYDFILIATGPENTIDTELFELTGCSEIKELTIYKSGQAHIFIPRQIPTKSKMAVRAAALGRKAGEWIREFVDTQKLSPKSRDFNSTYKRIAEAEQHEFLKEALNHKGAENTDNWLKTFDIDEAMREAARCLHCDCRKKDDCVLREMSTSHKASQRTYTLDKSEQVSKNTDHKLIVFERLKCIKCGICIQTAEQTGDLTGFAFQGRGFDVQITIPIAKNIQLLSDHTCLKCAENCPTGAIALK